MLPKYKDKVLHVKYWFPITKKQYLKKLKFQDEYLFKNYGIALENINYTASIVKPTDVIKQLKHLSMNKKKKLKVALIERLNECNPSYPVGIQTFNWALIIGSFTPLAIIFSQTDTINFYSFFALIGIIITLSLASYRITLRLDAYHQHSNSLQHLLDIMEIYKI